MLISGNSLVDMVSYVLENTTFELFGDRGK